MYRLLSITLSVLWGFAIFLSLLGLLPFSALAMIVSGAVLILASYLSNLLFGWLFGIRTHSESTYITALILFFIFSPSLLPTDIAALALVAVIASGSKYLLAIRGRHIFNPAAIAAVIISLTGITYATWWVATPVMLPMVLVCAFLILYKTRRLALGCVFLAVAIPLILINYALNGQTLAEAVLALPSWPLLFLVGFMLSEPLTLPPRRWQQLTVGAVVAALFAIPFHIGAITGSPALALVVGNAIAFLFAQRHKITMTFQGRIQLTPTISEFIFKTQEPIKFVAGQYMEITVPHAHKDGRGIRRIFSIVNAPGDTTVRFGVKMYDRSSSFKQALMNLQAGGQIEATGIGGDFVLPKKDDIPLLFIAGGIGITPFISHLLDLKKRAQHRDIILVHAVSSIDDISHVDALMESGIHVILVTETDIPMRDASWIHYPSKRLTAQDIAKLVPDLSKRRVYISGPPTMIDDIKYQLKRVGVNRVASDYFTGY
jgi:ferredoxin-NADP reductase